MISQETLYQLIYKEDWKSAIDELYLHRKEIANDSMLTCAGKIFETAFFSKINGDSSAETGRYLDTLYILHHGNFYQLSEDNYKLLILELVRRKPLKEAANYAKSFPNDPICKITIENAAAKEVEEAGEQSKIPMNWIEIFNRLFELINNQGDTATYVSGPKFINVVRETQPYFPDYQQYIDQRNKEGKSTSRKIFFYDILTGLDELSRKSVLIRFLDILKPFRTSQVEQIEQLLGLRTMQDEPETLTESGSKETLDVSPKVFISYSWDDENHKRWVLNLANRLRSNGVDVILDRYYLNAGKSVTHFVERSISDAKKILIIFTPNYKLKADQRKGGVGYEYSIMNNSLYSNQTSNDKIIPVLRMGTMIESIPDFMQQYIHLDLTKDETFENSYTDLLREIYNEPAIQIPEIGNRPVF
ncbi:MAG: TIR domain-containing protein [Flavobacterium sp.]|nr:MAG: TIR domain-containing protein [Flavobacterium sp.]